MDDEKHLPQWAQERLRIEREMGPLESNASPATVMVGLLVIFLRIGILVLLCVIIYVIGKAVVG